MAKFERLPDSNDLDEEDIQTGPILLHGSVGEVYNIGPYEQPVYNPEQSSYEHHSYDQQCALRDTGVLVESIPLGVTCDVQGAEIPTAKMVEPVLTVKCVTITGQVVVVPLMVHNPTVMDVKLALCQQKDFPISFQRLVFGGRELVDNESLADVGIENGYTLHLLLRKKDVAPPEGVPQPVLPNGELVDPEAARVDVQVQDYSRIHKLLSLSKAVKLVSIIDGMFLVLWSFSWWPFFLAIVLAWSGYYGAQTYKKVFILLYVLYILGSIAVRVVYLVQSDSFFYTVMLGIGICTEMYILFIVVSFYRLLRTTTPEDILYIRTHYGRRA